jgi:glycosyltransferase involved in cell wall biosynthesis
MRLGAYTDYTYHRQNGQVYGDRAFAIFLAALADRVDGLTIFGRVDPGSARARYPLGAVEFVELPYYATLAEPVAVFRALPGAIRRFWRALGGVDSVWVMGPHPVSIPLALLAVLRRKRVVLGVRQNLPAMIANRHPRSRSLRFAALVMEGVFRVMSRFLPVVVVGPELAANYRHSRDLLEITVSLVTDADLVEPAVAEQKPYDRELRLLSVGRLDPEKNPVLLADTLARARATGADWRLDVCGEGPMRTALEQRLEELALSEFADVSGYLPLRPDLLDRYRSSHALLHNSLTEGLPQVLVEAAASGLPIVATNVGGIADALGDAALLVPPGDPDAAAQALTEVATDGARRQRLIEAGHAFAAEHVLDRELDRLAAFIVDGRGPDPA